MHWRSDGKARPRTQLLPTPSEVSTRARLMSTWWIALYPVIPGLLGKGFAIRPHHLPPPGLSFFPGQPHMPAIWEPERSFLCAQWLETEWEEGTNLRWPCCPCAGTHAGSVPETENRVMKHTTCLLPQTSLTLPGSLLSPCRL